MFIFKLHFSHNRIVIFVSKYVQLNSMLILHPCVTCIYYYPDVKPFRVRKGSVAEFKGGTLTYGIVSVVRWRIMHKDKNPEWEGLRTGS
jgi:hypothetical protein